MKQCVALIVLIMSYATLMAAEPLPYNLIANPLPDTTNQIVRDSLNIVISPIRVNQAGYRPQDIKQFYYFGDSKKFSVIDLQNLKLARIILLNMAQCVYFRSF